MPVWNSEPGAANRWRLSVVVEGETGAARLLPNEIALALTEPLVKFTTPGVSWTDSPLEDPLLVDPYRRFHADLSFIFFSMCFTCTLTVLVISRRRAIILFGSPWAISLRTGALARGQLADVAIGGGAVGAQAGGQHRR